MFKACAAMVCLTLAAPVWAQMSPVGLWKSVDDKTGEAKSEIRISDQGGELSGRVEKLVRSGSDPAARCTACTDERKDQPMVGLEILRGAKKVEGKDVWEGGKILDPESGKTYNLRLTPTDNGGKLDVRGSIGPFGRTQTWVRVQ